MPATSPPSNLATAPFSGFPPGGYEFFLGLQANQSRPWFLEHKTEYEQLWAQPMRALGNQLAAALAPTWPRILESPPKVFRIQRDVRFSADKTPYKTNVAMTLPLRPARSAADEWEDDAPVLYLHFGLEGDMIAAGRWQLGKAALAEYRQAVDHPETGAPLEEIMDRLTTSGFEASAHDRLKRVPSPFGADHPRAGLLKNKGLAVSRADVPDELMSGPEFLTWLVDQFQAVAPLIAWMEQNLASA